LNHINTPFFTREFFTKNNMTVVLHPPYSPDLAPCNISLLPQLKIKLKGHHFDTAEVIKAEPQAVLKTVTDHDFQHALKKLSEVLGIVHMHRMDYFKGDGGQESES
jgi:hypothetical protein